MFRKNDEQVGTELSKAQPKRRLGKIEIRPSLIYMHLILFQSLPALKGKPIQFIKLGYIVQKFG